MGYSGGYNLTTGDNNIDIGSVGIAGESNTIRIGQSVAVVPNAPDNVTLPAHTATFIAGIFGAATSGGIPVYIDANGQLGTVPSSQRFKNDVASMDKASEAILSLRPVTFRYKKEIDPKNLRQFGLVAEEVEKVDPDLVTRDADGKIYTVRYEAVNAMLLNEFLKQYRTVQELKFIVAKQEATIAQQQKGMEVLTASLKEQAAQIQKVSARLEVKEPAPQIADNKR